MLILADSSPAAAPDFDGAPTPAPAAPAAAAPSVVVFLGPSLPVEEARAIFPDATYLPPARQGDVLSAVGIHRPDVIALVDGEFGQSLSVWHKEILYAMERGIHVYGASSMGALRAAECAPFGMKGVGRVYSMFASGELTDDDEVALAHAHDEAGYRALSVPMVNVRVSLAEAARAGVVSAAQARRLTEIAKGLFFPERSYARVLRQAAGEGMPEETVAALREWLAAGKRDVKRDDAVELLRTLAALPRPLPRHQADFTMERTQVFEALFQRDRLVRHEGTEVSLADVASHAALNLPAFGDLAAQALNRELTRVLADVMEVEATPEMIEDEARRLRVRLKVGKTDEDMAEWMRANDLEPDEFQELMRGEAEARAMRRWLSASKGHPRITREILDELRLRGLYPEVARRAAVQEGVLAREFPHLRDTPSDELETLRLVIEHMRATQCRMDTAYTDWAEEVGMKVEELRTELLRARAFRQYLARMADVGAEPAGAGR
ncbi:MAG TPA: TfuA-like protein [Longimicrobiaceae bacterium]|nr:TfuA-like protein [Longimicrobiaceae bacterium]